MKKISIAKETCHLHPEVAAAVRCPSCGMFCCRECSTEHEGKRICTICLEKEIDTLQNKSKGKNRFLFSSLGTLLWLSVGFALLWIAFFGFAQLTAKFRSVDYFQKQWQE